MISHGLIIDHPWVELILAGVKSWEMRSRRTDRRGPIGLIAKGSGAVVGTADLVESHGPLTDRQCLAAFDRHRIPPDLWEKPGTAKYRFAWELLGARRLASPIPYRHSPGAVVWVVLDEVCRSALARATG